MQNPENNSFPLLGYVFNAEDSWLENLSVISIGEETLEGAIYPDEPLESDDFFIGTTEGSPISESGYDYMFLINPVLLSSDESIIVEIQSVGYKTVELVFNPSSFPDLPGDINVPLNIVSTSDTISVSWENEEGYEDIRVHVNGEAVWEEENIELSDTSALLKNLQPGTEYEIEVDFRMPGDDFPLARGSARGTTQSE